jgi:hypothetical protein
MRDLSPAETRVLIAIAAVPLTIFLNLDVDYSVNKLTVKTKSSADLATALTAVGGAYAAASTLWAKKEKESTKKCDEDDGNDIK